jgi:hypothetical protein
MKPKLNIIKLPGDPDIEVNVWKAAANWYGSVEGKLVASSRLRAEVISAVEVEVTRLIKLHRAKQPRGSNG